MSYYGDGKFEFIHGYQRDYFCNAHWAITETGNWDWIASVDPRDGFMCLSCPEIDDINNKMREQPDITDYHSGSSYGITMRYMQYIAIYGYDTFKANWIQDNGGYNKEKQVYSNTNNQCIT